jgi:hypothetical protein
MKPSRTSKTRCKRSWRDCASSRVGSERRFFGLLPDATRANTVSDPIVRSVAFEWSIDSNAGSNLDSKRRNAQFYSSRRLSQIDSSTRAGAGLGFLSAGMTARQCLKESVGVALSPRTAVFAGFLKYF